MKVQITSIPQDSEINASIKPIDKQDATAEIEKNEVVYNPTTMLLHKALGKRHSQGGTPVDLEAGSFIFSDFAKLALSKKDKEKMEFKPGGTSKFSNTPAKVLQREVNLKHHNKMVNILQSDRGDQIAKNSAQVMVGKNLEKVGQVAYKQEEKKHFKDEIPSFSKGTLPIYSNQLDDKMKKSEQYQQGGSIRYIPKYQNGQNNVRDNYDWFTKRWGKFEMPVKGQHYDFNNLPNGYHNPAYAKDYMTVMNGVTGNNYPTTQAGWSQMRLDQEKNNPEYVQNAMQNNYINRNATTDFKYGDPNRPWYDGIGVEKAPRVFNSYNEQKDWEQKNNFTHLPGQLNKGYYVNPESGRYIGANLQYNQAPIQPVGSAPVKLPTDLVSKNNYAPTPVVTPTTTNPSDEDLPLIGNAPKLRFTDWQNLNHAWAALKPLTIKRYDPMRQHQESIIANPELQSSQPYLNDINRGYSNASNNLKSLTNASQVIAANNELAGNRLDQTDKTIGNVQNQNVSLLNVWKGQVANSLNQDAQQNRLFDKSYKEASDTVGANYSNAVDIASNAALEGFNNDASELTAAQSWYNTQPLVATDQYVKDKNGNRIGRLAQSPITPVRGFFGYTSKYNPNISAQGILNYQTGLKGDNGFQTRILAEIDKLDQELKTNTDLKSRAAIYNSRTSLLKLLQNKA